MILLPLLWITAWISSILLLAQSQPQTFTSKIVATKISGTFGKLVSQQRLFIEQPQQRVNIWYFTLLPVRFSKMPDIQQGLQTTPANLENLFLTKSKNSRTPFCNSLPDILVQQSTVQTPTFFSLPTLSEPLSPIQNFLSNKILRPLQNFFLLPNFVQQSFSSASLPVVVVQRNQDNYELWVNNHLVIYLLNKQQANLIQQDLTRLLKSHSLDASQLQPAFVNGTPAIMLGNRFSFEINKEISQKVNCSGDLLAVQWTNNLRVALQVPALSLVEAQSSMYNLKPSEEKFYGFASWYGSYFQGRLTANGEIFNQNELTVAHRSLPFNTYLQVTNLKTQKAVIVRVNDRGPYILPRSLDLSQIAARCINSEVAGVVPYEAIIMKPLQKELSTGKENSPLKTWD